MGGDTLFCDMYGAYEGINDKVRNALDGLRAVHDFTRTFDNKPASTEDFKAIVEKHITPAMDVHGNRRMDWFFNQYVYGTGIAQYDFKYQLQDAGSGKWKVSGTLTRSGVPDNWVDLLPLYLHTSKGAVRLGFITAHSAQETV